VLEHEAQTGSFALIKINAITSLCNIFIRAGQTYI
jgi:hypothetical protein